MKKLTLLLSLLLLVACGKTASDKNKDTNPKDAILKDLSILEDKELFGNSPIKNLVAYSVESAEEMISIDKNNMDDMLKKAKNYQHCIIVVGTHTVVKVISFDDCLQSKSWGTCMPKVEGYIKKGDLQHQDDYANNIIGVPDNQVRMMYLFK